MLGLGELTCNRTCKQANEQGLTTIIPSSTGPREELGGRKQLPFLSMRGLSPCRSWADEVTW